MHRRRRGRKTPHKRAKSTLAYFGIKAVEPGGMPRDDESMPKAAHVLGPYVDGKTWRLVVLEGTRRKSVTVKTLAEAEQLKDEMTRALTDRSILSVGAALDEYLVDKRERGVSGRTVENLEYRLRNFLPLDVSLGQVSAERAQRLYDEERQRIGRFGRPIAAASHRLLLRMARAFFRWAVEREYLRENPFERVRPVGKMNVGKMQLRLDEARRLTNRLWEHAEGEDEGATALLTQLFLGLRSSEVLGRQVRDLDDGGRILLIGSGKTHNARRRLEVPERLRPLLLRQAENKRGEARLFGAERERPYFTDFLWHRLRRYCAEMGLPSVCPHSLRGLHSTLALEAGVTSSAVASALGHGSFAVTARHYASADTVRNATVRRVSAALGGEGAQVTAPPVLPAEVMETLRGLSPEQLQAVIRSVAGER